MEPCRVRIREIIVFKKIIKLRRLNLVQFLLYILDDFAHRIVVHQLHISLMCNKLFSSCKTHSYPI